MKRFKIILAIFTIASVLNAQEKDEFLLFYLGGQSNMDGHGYNKDLPDTLNQTFENVWIFHGNPTGDDQANGGLGKWEELKPGHGAGFSSDGKTNNLSEEFGLEISFAKRIQQLYPEKKIAIIKYSRGGSSIDSLAAGNFGCWDPDYNGKTGLNQYDYFLRSVKSALAVDDINGDGKMDVLIPKGILWMQGESDADKTEEIAMKYYDNLKRLMDLLRSAFLTDDLPVVIGKISDSWNNEVGKVWTYGELVQYAQEKYARTEENAAIVKQTRYYGYSDRWHYDSEGYIDMGIRFANKVYMLNKK